MVSGGRGFDRGLRDIAVALRLVGAEEADGLLERASAPPSGGSPGSSLALLLEGRVPERELARALARASGLPPVVVQDLQPDEAARSALSPEVAFHYGVLAFASRGDALDVAVSPPVEPELHRELTALAGTEVRLHAACPGALAAAVQAYCSGLPRGGDVGPGESADSGEAGADHATVIVSPPPAFPQILESTGQAVAGLEGDAPSAGDSLQLPSPLERLLDLLIAQGLAAGAECIRLEPDGARLRVRFRVGDRLREGVSPPARVRSALLSHLAARAGIRSRMGVGRLVHESSGDTVPVRVQMVQSTSGRGAVLFPGADSPPASRLADLGLHPGVEQVLREALAAGRGLVVVAGPPDGGPAALRHAILGEAADLGRAVVSVEAMPEAPRPGVLRLEGRRVRGELRLALSLDPDVLGLDGLDGREDLAGALGAAAGGRLVVAEAAGLDACGMLAELAGRLGPDAGLLGGLVVVAATRSLGTLCPACRREAPVPPSARLEAAGVREAPPRTLWAPGPGCSACRAGYAGHALLVEAVRVDAGLAGTAGQGPDVLRRTAASAGQALWRVAAWPRVAKGELAWDDVG